MCQGLKAQSAIEYLMTYGWMLLVVAIAGGAIFSMVGSQSIENVQGFESQHVNVQDFGLSETQGLQFTVRDPVGRTEVKEVRVRDEDSNYIDYDLSQDLSQNELLSLPGIEESGDMETLELEIVYNSGNLRNLTSSGSVQGHMSVGEDFSGRQVNMDGLVGYWVLTDDYSRNERLDDLSAAQNHGFFEGEYDIGDDYSDISEGGATIESPTFNVSEGGEFTFLLSFRWDGPQDDDTSTSGGMGRGNNPAYAIDIRPRDENLRAGIRTTENNLYITRDMEIGEWYHSVFVYDGEETGKLYINGSLEDSNTRSDMGEFVTTGDFQIGGSRGLSGSTRHTNRSMAQAKVFNRALTDSEVQELYETSNFY